jgi:isoleucyl-tRNA synthetase
MDWPSTVDFPVDHELVSTMDAVREVCSAALSLRKARGLRVRLPLPSLTVASPAAAALRPFADLIADEVNVRSVVVAEDPAAYCEQVLTVVPRVLGPRLGGQVQQVIKAVKAGEWSVSDGVVTAGGVTLDEGEYELKLVAVESDGAHATAALPGSDGVVVLDTAVTPELVVEGLARDVVRVVQLARRDVGLAVTDRISLTVDAPVEVADAVRAHEQFVRGEVLAITIEFGPVGEGSFAGAGALVTEGTFAGEVGNDQAIRVRVTPSQ